VEAVLNVVISLTLAAKFGLLGIAVGALIGILYRYTYFILFLKKNILFIRLKVYFFRILAILLICCINIYVYYSNWIAVNSVLEFAIYGCIIVLAESVLTIVLFWAEKQLSKKLMSE
jgi:hypothetical protein